MIGDMNPRVGDLSVEGVTGSYGIPGMNVNGERLIKMCVEHGLIIWNTWFKKQDIHKYTWVGAKQERMLMDYALVSKSTR